MRRLVLGPFAAVLLLAPPTLACLNDRDSESIEAGQLPEVLAVITGQFDRNPPRYYQMRLKRVAEGIEISPVSLPLYDDAAVACDRLGRFDEAIDWMEKKRALLERSDEESASIKEHWYRYYANIGTHWAHRWLKGGADRSRIEEMKTARDFIGKAIALKPGAHFGRESYQFKTLGWIIDGPSYEQGAQVLQSPLDGDDSSPPSEAIQGLCGLIVLGNAWESVDIFHALAKALDRFGDYGLAYQARLRCKELIDGGKGTLVAQVSGGENLVRLIFAEDHASSFSGEVDLDALITAYHDGRKAADARHDARSAFLLARLREGRHPDTDAAFWNDGGEAFAFAARDEDREATTPIVPAVIRRSRPAISPHGLGSLSVAPAGIILAALGVVAILAIVVGRIVLARARPRPPRKPEAIDVEWL